MRKLRVERFSLARDGFGAGPAQSLANPIGKGGEGVQAWIIPTAPFQRLSGNEAGTTGTDNDVAARGCEHIGAWILGRNMVGSSRGRWPDDRWNGWWGDHPPYHTAVLVLSHHARKPVDMAGGTPFHFVTDGIGAAVARAREAAQGTDVRLGGGVAAIRHFLQAALIDALHRAIAAILLGPGEHRFHGRDRPALGDRCKAHGASEHATHIVLGKA